MGIWSAETSCLAGLSCGAILTVFTQSLSVSKSTSCGRVTNASGCGCSCLAKSKILCCRVWLGWLRNGFRVESGCGCGAGSKFEYETVDGHVS